jgi:hypothetical protein
MMAQRIHTVWLSLTEITHGVWCDRCMTGAGYTVHFVMLSDSGASKHERSRCARCDASDDDDDEES